MKKILLFTITFSSFSFLKAQERKFWIDAQFVQNIGLDKWADNKIVNDELFKPSTSDFQIGLNWIFYKQWGLYYTASRGKGVYPAESKFSMNQYPLVNLDNYYIKDSVINNNRLNSLRLSLGFFYKIKYKKWEILPYIGIGTQEVNTPYHEYMLKEKKTNSIQQLSYSWYGPKELYTRGNFSYLSTRLYFSHNILRNTNLTFGIEYLHYFDHLDFSARAINYYDGTITNEYIHKGNRMKALGFNLGISYQLWDTKATILNAQKEKEKTQTQQ